MSVDKLLLAKKKAKKEHKDILVWITETLIDDISTTVFEEFISDIIGYIKVKKEKVPSRPIEDLIYKSFYRESCYEKKELYKFYVTNYINNFFEELFQKESLKTFTDMEKRAIKNLVSEMIKEKDKEENLMRRLGLKIQFQVLRHFRPLRVEEMRITFDQIVAEGGNRFYVPDLWR